MNLIEFLKTYTKIKWKSNKQYGGNHYIAIFRD